MQHVVAKSGETTLASRATEHKAEAVPRKAAKELLQVYPLLRTVIVTCHLGHVLCQRAAADFATKLADTNEELRYRLHAFLMTNNGKDLNFLHRAKNASGSVLPKEKRFKDAPIFDKGTG